MTPSSAASAALRGEVRDVLALVTRLHARVQSELASRPARERPEVRALLQRLEPRVYAHVSELEQALEPLRGRPSLRRRALDATCGRLARWLGRAPSLPEPTGDLREIYTLLSATSAAYLVLATSGSTWGDMQTAALAERCEDDVNDFLDEIALLLPALACGCRADGGHVTWPPERKGESRPLVANQSAAPRQQNRRVEIVIGDGVFSVSAAPQRGWRRAGPGAPAGSGPPCRGQTSLPSRAR